MRSHAARNMSDPAGLLSALDQSTMEESRLKEHSERADRAHSVSMLDHVF